MDLLTTNLNKMKNIRLNKMGKKCKKKKKMAFLANSYKMCTFYTISGPRFECDF